MTPEEKKELKKIGLPNKLITAIKALNWDPQANRFHRSPTKKKKGKKVIPESDDDEWTKLSVYEQMKAIRDWCAKGDRMLNRRLNPEFNRLVQEVRVMRVDGHVLYPPDSVAELLAPLAAQARFTGNVMEKALNQAKGTRKAKPFRIAETFALRVARLFVEHGIEVKTTKGENPSRYVKTLGILMHISHDAAHELARAAKKRLQSLGLPPIIKTLPYSRTSE